jgi:hypothetical protein
MSVYRGTDGGLTVCFESKGVVDDVNEGEGAVNEGEGERLRLKWRIAGVRIVRFEGWALRRDGSWDGSEAVAVGQIPSRIFCSFHFCENGSFRFVGWQ